MKDEDREKLIDEAYQKLVYGRKDEARYQFDVMRALIEGRSKEQVKRMEIGLNEPITRKA